MKGYVSRAAIASLLALAFTGCAVGTSQAPPPSSGQGQSTKAGPVDPRQAQRLQQIMVPLIQVMNRPIPLNQVRVGIMADPQINAANAGGGEFYVTTGLLEKANDDQLRAVLAHEIAHADLGHVAKTQALGAGVNIGMIILDQIIPGSGALTPIAGRLLVNAYTRKEEYEADAHGVTILKRAGHDGRTLMANTLSWLMQTTGGSKGGFFATHPATADRIEAVRNLR